MGGELKGGDVLTATEEVGNRVNTLPSRIIIYRTVINTHT